jgi:hypothetical protein
MLAFDTPDVESGDHSPRRFSPLDPANTDLDLRCPPAGRESIIVVLSYKCIKEM